MLSLFSRRVFEKGIQLFDVCITILSLALAYLITYRQVIDLSSFLSIKLTIKHFLSLGILIWIWHVTFTVMGLYQSKRISERYLEYVDIIKSGSLVSLSVWATARIFNAETLNISFIAIFWLTTCISMILGRTVIREFLSALRKKGKNLRNIIIVGSGNRARKFVEVIHRRKKLGYQLLGFVDDDWHESKIFERYCDRLGNLSEIPIILNNYIVDEVTISLPVKSYYQNIEEIIGYCEEQGIIVRLLTDFFTVTFAKSKLTKLDEVQVLTLHSAPYEDPRMVVKRAFDVFVSFIMLILLSPLLITVAICIKVFSRGSIFFVQERVGYNKRIFKLLKFRTMIENAEQMLPSLEHLNEADGASFKIKDDPRITKFGKFLRKTSIDELPQLINVLKGDMSLVGPRPLQLRDFMALGANWHKRRFSMMPGITCFWQVNGRSNVSFARWMELDMLYIDQWSLWLDLKILWKTIPSIITGKGAM